MDCKRAFVHHGLMEDKARTFDAQDFGDGVVGFVPEEGSGGGERSQVLAVPHPRSGAGPEAVAAPAQAAASRGEGETSRERILLQVSRDQSAELVISFPKIHRPGEGKDRNAAATAEHPAEPRPLRPAPGPGPRIESLWESPA